MPDDLDPDVLERYCAGRSLPAERQLIARWLAIDPARGAALDALRDGLRDAPPFDVEAMLTRVDTRIERDARRVRKPAPAGRLTQGGMRGRWWWAAAAAVALLGSGVVALQHVGGRGADVTNAGAPTIIATGKGERKVVTLGDGSKVLLAPASRLAIYRTYGREQRAVALEGRALFTVRHDAERPFRVRTPMGVVEDLGTEFDVRAYREDHAEQIVVASGTVLVRANHGPTTAVVLQRDQMARLGGDGAMEMHHNVDAHALLGWVRGEIVFNDTPLEQVAAELGRWYNLDIALGDARVRNERFTATFRQSTLDHALDVVAQALDLDIVRSPAQPGVATLSKIILRSRQPH